MTTRIHLVGLSALCFLFGCRDDPAVGASDRQAVPGETDEGLGDRARRLGADTRDLLVDSFERGIAEADDKLAELRARYGPEAEQTTDEAREGWREVQDSLERARQDAAARLAELRTASAARYEEARQSFQAAYERLEQQLARAREHLERD